MPVATSQAGALVERTLWVLVEPAKDLPGQWVGHCLRLDIVSQGDSLEAAIAATCDAVRMCVHDDIENGADPFLREQAPDEDWEPLYRLMKDGVPLSSVPVEKHDLIAFAASQIHLVYRERQDHETIELAPGPWPMAGLRARRERTSDAFNA